MLNISGFSDKKHRFISVQLNLKSQALSQVKGSAFMCHNLGYYQEAFLGLVSWSSKLEIPTDVWDTSVSIQEQAHETSLHTKFQRAGQFHDEVTRGGALIVIQEDPLLRDPSHDQNHQLRFEQLLKIPKYFFVSFPHDIFINKTKKNSKSWAR